MPELDPFRPSSGPSPLLALADRCVQCGLCLPHCPTYRLDANEAESPRGRIAYIKAVASGSLAPTPLGDLHLDHCLGCRRCEGACPAGVEYGRLLVGARSGQSRRERRGPLVRWRLGLLARPATLARLLGLYRRAFAWLPRRWRTLPRPPAPVVAPVAMAGATSAAVFVGCIARSYEGPARAALYRLAEAAGLALAEPCGQTCCGAAAAHSGDGGQAGALALRNAAAFAGRERVLCLASGCQPTLAASLDGVAAVEDALVFLAAHAERLRFRDAGGRRVALHLPCTQFALPGSIAAMRKLLAMVPGLEVVDVPDTGCCGAAGMHMVEFPERAARLRSDFFAAFERVAGPGACVGRVQALDGSGRVQALDGSGRVQALRGQPCVPGMEILSASHGCRLHLAGGSLVPVRHPLEFLAEFLA